MTDPSVAMPMSTAVMCHRILRETLMVGVYGLVVMCRSCTENGVLLRDILCCASFYVRPNAGAIGNG